MTLNSGHYNQIIIHFLIKFNDKNINIYILIKIIKYDLKNILYFIFNYNFL